MCVPTESFCTYNSNKPWFAALLGQGWSLPKWTQNSVQPCQKPWQGDLDKQRKTTPRKQKTGFWPRFSVTRNQTGLFFHWHVWQRRDDTCHTDLHFHYRFRQHFTHTTGKNSVYSLSFIRLSRQACHQLKTHVEKQNPDALSWSAGSYQVKASKPQRTPVPPHNVLALQLANALNGLYCRLDKIKLTPSPAPTHEKNSIIWDSTIGHRPHPGRGLVWLILPVPSQDGQPSSGAVDSVLHCNNPVCSLFIHRWITHQRGQGILYIMNIHSLFISWHCYVFLCTVDTLQNILHVYRFIYVFSQCCLLYYVYKKTCQMFFVCQPTWPLKLILLFYKVMMCFYVKS